MKNNSRPPSPVPSFSDMRAYFAEENPIKRDDKAAAAIVSHL
jgi:hypothetical protein